MLKVMVIGAGGGGKSTFSRALAGILGVCVHHLDSLQFDAKWKDASLKRFETVHEQYLAEPAWIIDGWGTPESIDRRMASADTIIIVDYPIRIHYWRTFKRQIIGMFRPIPDFPAGCTVWPLWRLVFRWIHCAHHVFVPRLVEKAQGHRDHAAIHHIRQPRQLADLLAQAKATPPIRTPLLTVSSAPVLEPARN